jgi:hypothetical protein
MRAHPYREKRRIRHDRRVAARLKRKMLAEEERSGNLVSTSDPSSVPMVLHPAGLPMVIEPTTTSTLAILAARQLPRLVPRLMPRLAVLKPSPFQVYSAEDLRRLELILRKRTRHRQQFFLPAPEIVRQLKAA